MARRSAPPARASSASAPAPSSDRSATPIRAPTCVSRPHSSNGCSIAASRRSHSATAPAGDVMPCCRITNSSAPLRASMSHSRSTASSRAPACRSSRSPATDPRAWLIALKPARSTHSTATIRSPWRAPSSTACSRSRNAVRFGNPVSASCAPSRPAGAEAAVRGWSGAAMRDPPRPRVSITLPSAATPSAVASTSAISRTGPPPAAPIQPAPNANDTAPVNPCRASWTRNAALSTRPTSHAIPATARRIDRAWRRLVNEALRGALALEEARCARSRPAADPTADAGGRRAPGRRSWRCTTRDRGRPPLGCARAPANLLTTGGACLR